MVVNILKAYEIFIIVLMVIYTARHFLFSTYRLIGRQRLYYNDIYTDRMPPISVLVPMHNEELVLKYCLDALLACDYDRDLLEIIPINDNSTDRTEEMLNEYAERYDCIHPLHRHSENRGKPAGLNEAMELAMGDIIIVFDADYRPAQNMLKELAVAFQDPEIGAVMGRVIPYNAGKNVLTRLINLERSGGYQVDQQARYDLKMIPQYGGTVGGFRKELLLHLGGFDPKVLAEDTELTFRLYTSGYKVIYANSAECYEEAPETWQVRGRQVRRWSRGHNEVMLRYFWRVLGSKYITGLEKLDGVLLLLVYAIPFLLLVGQFVALALFLMGEMNLFRGWWVLLFLGVYNSFGNFAPFFEIGNALIVDGMWGEAALLPLLLLNFFFYMWNISLGFLDAVVDALTGRQVTWAKTIRFTLETDQDEGAEGAASEGGDA